MENLYNKEERYFMAKKQVEDLKGFYINLITYIIVNAGLIILNLKTSPNHLWFYWPLMWWGIGLIFHGMKIFKIMPSVTKDWEQKKIKELMEIEKSKSRK